MTSSTSSNAARRRRTAGQAVYTRVRRALVGVVAVVGLGVFALVASGAAGPASAASAQKPVLTLGETTGPGGVDAPAGVAGDDVVSQGLAYEPLLWYDVDNEPNPSRPGLATSWRVYDKNQAIEFHLRHNAYYSNGEQVTAQTITSYFKIVAKTKAWTAGLTLIGGTLKSVKAVGKWTVVVHTTAPVPHLAYGYGNYNAGGYSAPAAPECAAKPDILETQTCGAGPYMIDPAATVAGSKYTWVPNPYYYDKAAQHWSKIVVLVIGTASSLLQALETGQVDFAEGDVTTVAAAKAHGFKVLTLPNSFNAGLFINFKASTATPLKNLLVRQAMNYAINRPLLAKAFHGTGTSQLGTLDGSVKQYETYYKYNPTKAKQLLTQAGYPHGFKITALTTPGTNFANLVSAVATQLAKVGINMTVKSVSNAAFGADFATSPIFQGGFGVTLTSVYYDLFFTPGGLSGETIPALTSLYNKASVLPESSQTKYWQQLVQQTVKQAYFIPTIIPFTYWYTNGKVKNFFGNGFWQLDQFKPAK